MQITCKACVHLSRQHPEIHLSRQMKNKLFLSNHLLNTCLCRYYNVIAPIGVLVDHILHTRTAEPDEEDAFDLSIIDLYKIEPAAVVEIRDWIIEKVKAFSVKVGQAHS